MLLVVLAEMTTASIIMILRTISMTATPMAKPTIRTSISLIANVSINIITRRGTLLIIVSNDIGT